MCVPECPNPHSEVACALIRNVTKKKKKPKKAENMHLCEKIKTHTGDAMHGAL